MFFKEKYELELTGSEQGQKAGPSDYQLTVADFFLFSYATEMCGISVPSTK